MMSLGLTCRPDPIPVPPPPVAPEIPGLKPNLSGHENGGTSYPDDINTYQPDWGVSAPYEPVTCKTGYIEFFYDNHRVGKLSVECV